MIFIIIAINLSITLLNIYIAIRIWQLRSLILRITAILLNYEEYFNIVLRFTPQILERGQTNIARVRQRYQLLQLQIAKLRQIIWLLNQGYLVWRKTVSPSQGRKRA